MTVRQLAWVFVLQLSAAGLAAEQPAGAGLKIAVLDGENGVNIVREMTAVQPAVQVRDRHDLPVAGATVIFRIRGKSASFANKIKQLTVTTDSDGRATVSGLRPRGQGTIRIQVRASYQGQTATTTIHQKDFRTLADAAKAAKKGQRSTNNGGSQARNSQSGGNHARATVAGSAASAGPLVAKKPLARPDCSAQWDQFSSTRTLYENALSAYGNCVITTSLSGACTSADNVYHSAVQPYLNAVANLCACYGQPSDESAADLAAIRQAYLSGGPAVGIGTHCGG
jgi:hypothetical protein